LDGPRIITPSRTACPPTVVIASGGRCKPFERLGRWFQPDGRGSSPILRGAPQAAPWGRPLRPRWSWG